MSPPEPLVVAISSRALFDLEHSHTLFEREGVEAYAAHQVGNEESVLAPGIGFPLVRKLLALNEGAPKDAPRVEVILLSRNSSDTGLRVFNSIQHHGLDIRRATFTSGAPTWPYVKPFGAHLFLSANAESVRRALQNGVAAAHLLPSAALEGAASIRRATAPAAAADAKIVDAKDLIESDSESAIRSAAARQIRIAFDGDAVLFDDEGERVTREGGLEAFARHERERAHEPLSGGPFRGFLDALHRLQAAYPADGTGPIRTALVTARSAPAHERVIRTLREWGIRLDEALFLGGRPKGPFLQAFGADIFFDDSMHNIESAREHVTAGHVPHGVANR
ncbi:MAG: 5'-nucleotidase [Lysobacter sp.]|nr:5'-nucleotidase [Lysobacter sp.]